MKFNPGEVVRVKPEAVRVLKDGEHPLAELLNVKAVNLIVIGQIHADVLCAAPPHPSRVVLNVDAADLEAV